MRELIAALMVVVAGPLAATDVDWETTPPLSGVVADGDVTVEGAGSHPLVRIEDPAVEGGYFEISGDVSARDVQDTAYLEMWVHFPDGGAFFSRTLATDGPMAAITGTVDARPFVLPFDYGEADPPILLEINAVLPGEGTITVGPLSIEAPGADGLSATDASRWAALAGVTLGLLGAIVGVVGGRGRAPRLVEAALWAGVLIGAASLIVAGSAIVGGRPRTSWSPFLMVGLVGVGVFGMLVPTLRKSQRSRELQRMRALDA